MSNLDKLPTYCYTLHPITSEVIKIVKGISAYYTIDPPVDIGDYRAFNNIMNVTPEQEEAMLVGSICGWDCDGANPDNYIFKNNTIYIKKEINNDPR